MIVVLGPESDEHGTYIRDVLRKRGFDARLLDVSFFPQNLRLAYEPCADDGDIVFADGERSRWSEIDCVYWRSYDAPLVPELMDPTQQWVAEEDARGLVETFLQWKGTRWVNSWEAWSMHRCKPLQLAAVAALELGPGLFVPETTVCNDGDDVLAFVKRVGQCIFKPVQGGAHARPLQSKHLTALNLKHLAKSPVTIQQHVEGTDVRVFLADEDIHACELRSSTLDYRDDDRLQLAACEIPPDVKCGCLAISRALGLKWTGIDLRRTSEGRYAFFEANPSPMFIGFEAATGLPLTNALLDLLTGSSTMS